MNTRPRQPNEQHPHKANELLARALDALQATAGITGKIIAMEPELGQGRVADADIALDVAGTLHRYLVETKRVDRFAALGHIKNQFNPYPHPGLLVAPRITAEIAEQCRKLDVQFIDTHGNAYLHAPGLFVWVKGQRQHADPNNAQIIMETPRAGTPAALKAIFALLCRPELLNAPYREIKQAAGIALGAVGGVFADLAARGYTTAVKGKGGRRLLEPQRLIDEWVAHYPVKLRPKLNPRRFHAAVPNWWQKTDITKYGAQWGGEIAADKLTAHLKPNTVTLYMRPANARRHLTQLVVDHQLRADPAGEIEVLDTFWDLPQDLTHPDLVPPLLVYADLLATMDPRNHETARMIQLQATHAETQA